MGAPTLGRPQGGPRPREAPLSPDPGAGKGGGGAPGPGCPFPLVGRAPPRGPRPKGETPPLKPARFGPEKMGGPGGKPLALRKKGGPPEKMRRLFFVRGPPGPTRPGEKCCYPWPREAAPISGARVRCSSYPPGKLLGSGLKCVAFRLIAFKFCKRPPPDFGQWAPLKASKPGSEPPLGDRSGSPFSAPLGSLDLPQAPDTALRNREKINEDLGQWGGIPASWYCDSPGKTLTGRKRLGLNGRLVPGCGVWGPFDGQTALPEGVKS